VITAIDSNIVIALWSEDDALNGEAARALELASTRGTLAICAPVYVEVRAFPGRAEDKLDDFLFRTGIQVEWVLEERIWREAAKAGHAYCVRRENPRKLPRRVSADFVIGAHAMVRDYPLLTLDKRTFRAVYPSLKMASGSS
jgi:predicted nucleic acid-binding protein